MNVSLAKLKHVLTVARLRNFSQAALELNISQPALSRSVARVEDEYGFRIFERSRSGVYVTSQGEEFIVEAESLLKAANVFDHNASIFSGSDAGRICFGLSPMLAGLILTPLAQGVQQRRPRSRVHASIKPAEELIEELHGEAIELFFCSTAVAIDTDGIFTQNIGAFEVAFMARPEHPLLTVGNPRPDDLASFPLACASEEGLSTMPKSRSLFTCGSYHIMRDLALATDTVLLSPPAHETVMRHGPKLMKVPVAGLEHMSTEIMLVRRNGYRVSAISQEIIADVIDEIARMENRSDPPEPGSVASTHALPYR